MSGDSTTRPVNPVSPGERFGFVYEINMLRCIFCALCVEACPTEAITMTLALRDVDLESRRRHLHQERASDAPRRFGARTCSPTTRWPSIPNWKRPTAGFGPPLPAVSPPTKASSRGRGLPGSASWDPEPTQDEIDRDASLASRLEPASLGLPWLNSFVFSAPDGRGGVRSSGCFSPVIRARNPVYAAMGLLATLFSMAVLYVLNLAHFVAAVQIIVYAGAVMTLFLFVIMLIGVDKAEDLSETIPHQRRLAHGAGFGGGRHRRRPRRSGSVLLGAGGLEPGRPAGDQRDRPGHSRAAVR